MLGSIGVILGALIIEFTGWTLADPIVAVLIGLWVLPRTWTLLREAGNVLMEGAPPGIDTEQVRAALLAEPGVEGVHDLHLWSLSSTRPAIATHIVATGDDVESLRRRLVDLLESKFGIGHVTLQVEPGACDADCEASLHR